MLCYNVFAQDEVDFTFDSSISNQKSNNEMHVLKLKKSYVLGEGITLRSSVGNLNISQTFQSLFIVNSANKDLSNLNAQFQIRRARLTMIGNLFDKTMSVVFRVNLPADYQSATGGNRTFNNTLQEAYFEYRPSRKHVFNIGLRADYMDSREIRFQGENNGFIERSAVSSSFDAIFDYGIRYKGNYSLGGRHILKPYLSITTGDSRSALQKNFGGFKYGVRLDYLPFDKFSRGGEFFLDDLVREEKPKLVIGAVYSYNDGATSAFGTNGGRFIYADAAQNVLLPKYSKFGIDYLFKYDGFYSLGSYFTTSATVPTNIKGEYRLNGTFNTYNTAQTEQQTQNLVLSRLNLGSGFNVQAGYVLPSDWSLSGRFSTLKSNTISASFATYNKYYTFNATKYLSEHNLKIQFEIGYDELDKAFKTTTQSGNIYSQIMFTVQL